MFTCLKGNDLNMLSLETLHFFTGRLKKWNSESIKWKGIDVSNIKYWKFSHDKCLDSNFDDHVYSENGNLLHMASFFPENLVMYLSVCYPSGFIKSHLCTQQTFILVKGRVILFMLFVFQGIRTCKDQHVTGMTISTLKSFCMASDSQILRIYFNSSVLCIPTEIFIFWKFDYMMTSGKEERDLSYVYISKWCGWNGFMDWNVWHWESHVHVISESILQSGFSADTWADWFIILDLLHFSI